MQISEINAYKIKTKTVKAIIIILRTLFVFGMCYVFLFPILYMLSVSIRSAQSVTDPSVVWVPKQFSFESIKEAIDILHFKQSAFLSFLISFFGTLGSLISCSLTGYGLSRFRFKEKRILFAIVIVMIIIPPQTLLISSFLNFRYFSLLGIFKLLSPITGFSYVNLTELPLSPLTLILPAFFATGLRSGLFIFIFHQFFSGMPKDLEEAAKIDGCGALRTYIKIIVPLAGTAFITVMLYSLIWHWNDFYTSAFYFTSDVKPLSVMLSNMKYLLQASSQSFVGIAPYKIRTYLAAGSLLVTLPPLIFYIFAQKYFTESIESTGIVG